MCLSLKSLLCGNKRQIFIPSAKDRLREFFLFCLGLEEHPFMKSHGKGGTFSLDANFPESGADTVTVNFDEVHLESLLTRIRQFLFPNELFYLKDLRRAVVEVFGESAEFRKFYDELQQKLNKKIKKTNFEAFKANGKNVTAGHTLKELVEARLYTGAIHSERRLNAQVDSASDGMANAHIAVSKQLSLFLASASLATVENIFSLRKHILLAARKVGKADLLDEVREFDELCKSSGC